MGIRHYARHVVRRQRPLLGGAAIQAVAVSHPA